MTMQRVAADAVSTRDAILDAAEQRFADHGFAGASVREIAHDVGLRNQASLYHYFESKEALYEAVLRRGVDELLPIWQTAGLAIDGSAGDSREDAIGAYLDRVFDYLVDHPHLARLIERAGLDEDQFVAGAVPRLLRPLYVQGVGVLEGVGAAWQPSQIPHLAAGLFHMIFGYFANASLLQAVLDDDPQSPRMLEHQRAFLKAAVARLLDGDPPRTSPRIVRRSDKGAS
ncbi:MAG TPA: TetR/AcrR family transcriptional regulator [Dehalococcoidia bacterium]|jgi:AcrR family transcriptional regulator|nr:TetR/AcrR family transcriptional regulator [Dehalococcoidia bacterium]